MIACVEQVLCCTAHRSLSPEAICCSAMGLIDGRMYLISVVVVLGLARFGVESFVGQAVVVGVRGNMRCMSSLNRRSRRLAPEAVSFAGSSSRRYLQMPLAGATMSAAVEIQPFPYTDVLPFLAEHVQPSDQMLLLGCGTELPLQLSRDGYGTRDGRSFLRCVDSDQQKIAAIIAAAEADSVCAENMANGRLIFQLIDVSSGIPELEQSTIDSVVDAGLLDHLITCQGLDAAKSCLDAAHRAVRLGNPLVAMSRIDKADFTAIFDGNFGWMQELDGDPGAISQWYRNKAQSTLRDVKNNFLELGISFFVYTNVDNC